MYALSAPLVLGKRDSGVSWVAEQGASISGGVALTGWSLAPFKSADGTPVLQTDVSGVVGAQDRHLFVQGQRAKRPRMDEAAAAALFTGHSMTEEGFTLAAGAPPWPRNGSGVEFVYPQSTSPWTEPRCAVASANATDIMMMQSCWRNLLQKACGQHVHGPPSNR
jgi:hypothetical protein